jgi:hypothetical protein
MATKPHIKNVIPMIAALVLPTIAQAGQTEPAMAPAPQASSDFPWGISVDALYLKAHQSEGDYDNQDEEFAYRAALSFKSGDNLGLRVRWFDFEGTDDDEDEGSDYPEATTLDFEVFDTFALGNWQGEYAAGLRWYNFDEIDDFESDGWGPTFGLEVTHPIVDKLEFYANARTSILFGDRDEIDGDDEDEDVTALVFETGLGLQYTFCLGAAESYIRLGVEAQNWSGVSEEDTEDAGLFGAALRLGFNF